MFDRAFFEEHLSKHATEKAKHSGTGSSTVKLRLSTGQTVPIFRIVETYDGYVVVEAHPEDGKIRENPQEERDLGADRYDLDRFAYPYHMITEVEITTRAPKNQQLGFQPR